jgi:hypothetical protein
MFSLAVAIFPLPKLMNYALLMQQKSIKKNVGFRSLLSIFIIFAIERIAFRSKIFVF